MLLNQAWPLTQTYTYDSLNRVATAQSLGTHSSAPGTCWAETYNYDAWGNLYSFGPNSTTQSAYVGCSQESGLSSSATTKNQLSTYTYDAAGNLITIPAVANYTYDAENHLVSAGGLNYSYDGDGKRVMKSNGVLYWYGAGSDPLFESDTSGYQIFKHFYFNGMRVARQEGWAQGYWIDHYVSDALGNARFVYGYNGAWDVSDYYPFGGERPYQSQEGNTFKFTGKERDGESTLDNFGARYYSSSMGRFISPDPGNFSGFMNPDDPQSWNGYSYAQNNPLNLVDPSGLGYCQWSLSTGGVEDRDDSPSSGGATQGECGDQMGKWIQEAGDPQLVRNDSGDTGVISTPGTTVTVNGDTGFVDTVSYGGGEIVQRDQPVTDQQKLLALKVAGLEAEQELGCVVPGFGTGDAGAALWKAGQPVPGSKRFRAPGTTVGSSPASEFLRDTFRGKSLPFQVPVPVGGPGTGTPLKLAWGNKVGATLGRLVPWAGIATTAYGAYQVNKCLSQSAPQ